jgi:hypothetical protein
LPPEFCTEHGTNEAIFGFMISASGVTAAKIAPFGSELKFSVPDYAGSKGDVVQSGNGTDGGPGQTDNMNDTESAVSSLKSSKTGSRNAQDKSVGDALRAVYHDAVDEKVPDSMLDLLSKLG